VPICFVLTADILYSAVDLKPKSGRRLRRLANIEANPRVSLLVDHYQEDWSRLWWVRLDGEGEVLDSGVELEAALRLLARKYEQYRAAPPPGPVLKVTVRRWSGWEAMPSGQAGAGPG
jgi:PPOX class probable F420-dependent enzyme